MKAEEVLDKMIDEMPFNMALSNRPYVIEALKLYARIQIDKDRKRIKEAYYSDTDFGDFNNLLKSTKINLES